MDESFYNAEVVEAIRDDFMDRHDGKDMDDCIVGAAEILLALIIEDALDNEDALLTFDSLTTDLRSYLAEHNFNVEAVQ